jgi:hypothetical protein
MNGRESRMKLRTAELFLSRAGSPAKGKSSLLGWGALLMLPFVGLQIAHGGEGRPELGRQIRGRDTNTAAGIILTVNSTADAPDIDQLDGVCKTATGDCTLRAAVMQANFAGGATIVVPRGTYKLTRVHYDDDSVGGDLDISADVTIQGAGSAVTIVDGNGPVTHDRVFQVLSAVQNFTLSGMTIRNGESLPQPSPAPTPTGILGGGGLYIEGAGHVLLRDVIFDSNTGQNGGGVYANFSSTGGSIEMDNVILRSNMATAGGVGAGGGVLARLAASQSRFMLKDSQLYSNAADGTGGGMYVDGNSAAQWSIERSEIYLNTAPSGGGIGNFIPLTLSDSSLHDNHVTFDGGAIEAYSPSIILRTTLDANSAGRFGGGIFNLQTAANSNYSDFCHIEECTLSRNFALYGGAIYHDGFITAGSLLHIINSTVSGNAVSKNGDGGGIYQYEGQTQLLNSTVANNRVLLGLPPNAGTGKGGGLYIFATASDANTFISENSIIANNARDNGIQLGTPDDGFTTNDQMGATSGSVMGNLGFNLIRTTTNFFINGPQGNNINGQDPLLGPLKDNGGATYTMELLSNSPAVDAGSDLVLNSPSSLSTDQRGYPRKIGGHVDMGAFEFEFGGRLRVISISRSGSDILVTFQALQGATYRLLRKFALTDPTWQSISGVSNITATSTGPAGITDPGAINLAHAFYKVELLR